MTGRPRTPHGGDDGGTATSPHDDADATTGDGRSRDGGDGSRSQAVGSVAEGHDVASAEAAAGRPKGGGGSGGSGGDGGDGGYGRGGSGGSGDGASGGDGPGDGDPAGGDGGGPDDPDDPGGPGADDGYPEGFDPDDYRHEEFVDQDGDIEQSAIDAYRRIRNDPESSARIAEQLGVDPAAVERARQNLFVQEHDVQIGPDGRTVHGMFTPRQDIADRWERAADGTLTPDETRYFKGLIAHEYVENRLMEAGVPYQSPHPEVWDEDGTPWFRPDHFGAHMIAPLENHPNDPFKLWERAGLDSSGLSIADDLSNLNTISDSLLRQLGR